MRKWSLQGVRFLTVGLTSNLLLYLAYLVLTRAGLGPKAAMTGLYAVGTLQTFVVNRRWTFSHQGDVARSLRRYVVTYAAGYLLNLAILALFVDGLGWRHEIVQAAAVLTVAAATFLGQRFWVFSHHTGASR